MHPAERKTAADIQAAITAKLGSGLFSVREKPAPELIPTGIPEVDTECGGIPRGVITEITGPASSGRTTLLHSILAGMTARGEACALVDPGDAFDPSSADAAGAALNHLLWIRCGKHKNDALRVTDLLLQNGGWGMIVLDLADVDPQDARRIPLHTWHRFRLAIENKPTVFLVMGKQPNAASCSAMVLQTRAVQAHWQGRLLRGTAFEAQRRKPAGRTAVFEARTREQRTGYRAHGEMLATSAYR
jgi:recombination protein RecA